jgi:hypothetical protein
MFEQEESKRSGASAKPAPRGSHLLLRKKNQSISPMGTTAKTRVTRKSPMVFSTVYPFC